MGRENPTWGEDVPDSIGPRRAFSQRWSTFVQNHSNVVVACDFFVSVTATFRVLYVFVSMESGSRRILHCNCPVCARRYRF